MKINKMSSLSMRMKLRKAYSLRLLFFAVMLIVFLCGWVANEVRKGKRDADNFDAMTSSATVANTFFETGYVVIPIWLGERGGSLTAPFCRVVEIDFRLDTLDEPKDILPFAIFDDVRLIRIDSFPKAKDGIMAFKKFKNLKRIYVAWPKSGDEIREASKLLPGIEILQGQ